MDSGCSYTACHQAWRESHQLSDGDGTASSLLLPHLYNSEHLGHQSAVVVAEGGWLAGSEGLCLPGMLAKMPGVLLTLTALLGLGGPARGGARHRAGNRPPGLGGSPGNCDQAACLCSHPLASTCGEEKVVGGGGAGMQTLAGGMPCGAGQVAARVVRSDA